TRFKNVARMTAENSYILAQQGFLIEGKAGKLFDKNIKDLVKYVELDSTSSERMLKSLRDIHKGMPGFKQY
ncbi:MAG TPA: hypothetical protein VF691_12150, partial [Cytophagaceae bacterium]